MDCLSVEAGGFDEAEFDPTTSLKRGMKKRA
jgi:hypothetical protein